MVTAIYRDISGSMKNNNLKTDRKLKILCILPFLFLISALLIILSTPASTSYEMSIYDVYPLYFWFLLIFSIFTGTLVLIESYPVANETKYWKIGLLAIIVSNIILLIMPIIRNYPIFGREDILSHLGWIKYIMDTGYYRHGFLSYNAYNRNLFIFFNWNISINIF